MSFVVVENDAVDGVSGLSFSVATVSDQHCNIGA